MRNRTSMKRGVSAWPARALVATLVLATGGVASAQTPQYQAEPQPPPLVAQPLPAPPPPQPIYPAAPQPLYPAAPGPRTLEWEPGEPVPAGYHVTTQFRKGLVIGGAVVFGSVWLLNALVASIGIDTNQGQAAPLFVPIVGPFIAMGTFRSLQALDTFFLALDGLTQAGGAAMLIIGLAVPTHQLTRNRYASGPWILPMPMSFGAGSAGLGLVGMM